MALYDLSLESGPQRRKTMVHVPGLLGCVASGSTTEAALDATPEAIRAFRRFLVRHGDDPGPDDGVDLVVVEHITAGQMLGEGSPYITFAHDLAPIDEHELAAGANRLRELFGELAGWAGSQDDADLDAPPPRGRTAREILLHVMGANGPALSIALTTAPGLGAIHGAAKRGERPIPVALLQTAELSERLLLATTAEQRSFVRERESGSYTLRKSVRRMLEHAWDHTAELSRRPGGPRL